MEVPTARHVVSVTTRRWRSATHGGHLNSQLLIEIYVVVVVLVEPGHSNYVQVGPFTPPASSGLSNYCFEFYFFSLM